MTWSKRRKTPFRKNTLRPNGTSIKNKIKLLTAIQKIPSASFPPVYAWGTSRKVYAVMLANVELCARYRKGQELRIVISARITEERRPKYSFVVFFIALFSPNSRWITCCHRRTLIHQYIACKIHRTRTGICSPSDIHRQKGNRLHFLSNVERREAPCDTAAGRKRMLIFRNSRQRIAKVR